jgi:hypothetical protein
MPVNTIKKIKTWVFSLKLPSWKLGRCVTQNNTIIFPPFQHHDLHLASSVFLQTEFQVYSNKTSHRLVLSIKLKTYNSYCQNYDKIFLPYYCFTCFIQHFTVHLFFGPPKYTINSTDSLHYLVSCRLWQFWTYVHFISDQK